MARAYLAQRVTRQLRKLVVLKVLEPILAADEEMRSAFRREAELCVRLNHPNLVQVFEVVEEEDLPMIVMEYVEGVALSQIVSKVGGRLPLRLHLHIVQQALAGLHYFHELTDERGAARAPVHRDVSPQNVMVMHEGATKVLDFGIAKLRDVVEAEATRVGIIKGKLNYMPLEQMLGDATIDRRADLFSAGVMLWEAFAGRRMWQGLAQSEVVEALASGAIPQIRAACPEISTTWEAIVVRATASKREDRYATAAEMQEAMEAAMGELGGAVLQREVATFMRVEFGAVRQERQRLVDAEGQRAAVPLAAVLGDSSGRLPTPQLTPTHLNTTGSVATTTANPGKPLLALLTAAAAGLAAFFWWQGRASQPATLSGHVQSTSVAPERGPAPSAPLSVVRPPLPSAVAAPSPPPSQPEATRAKAGSPGRRRAPPRAELSAGASATPVAANCDPPFSISANGVKSFKPECL
jgi:serine/threonine-protein kinase